MSTGPVEYLVIAFPDGQVSDEFAAELGDLVDRKLIRILDLVFVRKDDLDQVAAFEFDELDGFDEFASIDAEVGGLIGDDDIAYVGGSLAPGSAAAVLVAEDTWAASLASALDRSGGVLLEGARIPKDLVDVALAGLA
jgi:Family of unknown function (DUF6325)